MTHHPWPTAVLTLCAGFAVPHLRAAEADPSPEQIASWVRQLGDEKFAVREQASRKLWEAGQAAEDEVRRACRSSDPEVSRRARELVGKFQWGIYPSTPPALVELITLYQGGDPGTRGGLVPRFFDHGAAGCRALAKLVRAVDDADSRKDLQTRIATDLPRIVPALLEENQPEALEGLLEIGLASDPPALEHYAAYWLMRGMLDAALARHKALAQKNPRDKTNWEVLARLFRARGDPAAALGAARKSERDDLVEGFLYEAGDWRELAGRQAAVEHLEYERLGYRAAYHRLAGNVRDFEAVAAELRRSAAEMDAQKPQFFLCVKALFLNDRAEDAVKLLSQGGRLTQAAEVLCTRMQYKEAFELLNKARVRGSPQVPELEILMARQEYSLGEQARAQATFAEFADRIKPKGDASWYEALVDGEHRVGLTDQALAHAARILDVADEKTWLTRLLGKVFPDRRDAAREWWAFFKERFPAETSLARLQRLQKLLSGKTEPQTVRAWVEGAGDWAEHVSEPGGEKIRWQALAEGALASGLEAPACACLEKADAAESWLRLGDLLAEKKKWDEAAARYRQAWEKDRRKPLPLYLSGWALARGGREKEGRQRMDEAHWLPMGDEAVRAHFLRGLSQRGHKEAVRRETDLLHRLSEPGSYYAGEAQRFLADQALGRRDWEKAADCHEQAMLRCLRTYVGFGQASAYVMVPALVHRQRARGLVARGKMDEARREMALCEAALPGDVDLPILVVPELERRGHGKEASEMYDHTRAVCERVCLEYPRCAWAHNVRAWLAACCRRDLDQALAHAQLAVELAPTQAGLHDTLAEVYFQRGDHDRAAAAQRKAIELDPKRVYFRRQLRRIEAGDPAADRPTDEEE